MLVAAAVAVVGIGWRRRGGIRIISDGIEYGLTETEGLAAIVESRGESGGFFHGVEDRFIDGVIFL